MYITCLQVHTDLVGNSKKIVRCGSNKVGKYTTVAVDLYSMGYFIVIDVITDLPSEMVGTANIHKDLLAETSSFRKFGGSACIPTWIIVYFGENLTYVTLLNDKIRDSVAAQGSGYKTWADTVILSMSLAEDIIPVVDTIKEDQTQLELYMGSACTTDCKLPWHAMCSLASNGHFSKITIAPSM